MPTLWVLREKSNIKRIEDSKTKYTVCGHMESGSQRYVRPKAFTTHVWASSPLRHLHDFWKRIFKHLFSFRLYFAFGEKRKRTFAVAMKFLSNNTCPYFSLPFFFLFQPSKLPDFLFKSPSSGLFARLLEMLSSRI